MNLLNNNYVQVSMRVVRFFFGYFLIVLGNKKIQISRIAVSWSSNEYYNFQIICNAESWCRYKILNVHLINSVDGEIRPKVRCKFKKNEDIKTGLF